MDGDVNYIRLDARNILTIGLIAILGYGLLQLASMAYGKIT